MSDTLTYEKLVERISSYAERNDEPFINLIPSFISLAENRIASELKGLGNNKIVQFTTIVDGDGVYEKPTRWRETKSLMLRTTGGWKTVFPRSYEYCRAYQSGTADVPEFYCDYGKDHILIVNKADDEYEMEWSYYERLAPLSSSNGDNWLTLYQPNLILVASMVEACIFLKRKERQDVFESEYMKYAELFTVEDSKRVSDNSVRRTK